MKDEATVDPQSASIFDYAFPPSPWQDWGISTTPSRRGFANDFPFTDAVGILVYSPYTISGG